MPKRQAYFPFARLLSSLLVGLPTSSLPNLNLSTSSQINLPSPCHKNIQSGQNIRKLLKCCVFLGHPFEQGQIFGFLWRACGGCEYLGIVGLAQNPWQPQWTLDHHTWSISSQLILSNKMIDNQPQTKTLATSQLISP